MTGPDHPRTTGPTHRTRPTTPTHGTDSPIDDIDPPARGTDQPAGADVPTTGTDRPEADRVHEDDPTQLVLGA